MKRKIRIHTSLLLALALTVISLCAAAPGVSAIVAPYGSVSTGSPADEKIIWDYFMIKFGNAYGVAGLMGNLFAESGLRSNDLEGAHERSLGYTDETYTKAVDENRYKNFVTDSAGYGLAQWTYSTRKKALLNFVRERGVSIADFGAQLDFLSNELDKDYSSVVSSLKSAKSVKEASNTVLTKFEKPSDQSWSVQNTRASYSQTYYNKYVNSPVDMSEDDTPPVISGVTVSDVTSYGYTLKFTVTDDYAVSKVTVPVWTEKNGKDDLVSHEPARDGNSFTLTVGIGDHNSESGIYNTQINAYDIAGNVSVYDVQTVKVPSMGSGTVIVTSKIMLTAINGDQWADNGAYVWTEGTFKAVWWIVIAAVKDGINYRVTAIYKANTGSKSVTTPSGGVLIAVHASDKNYETANEVKVGDHFVLYGVTGTSLSSGAYAGFGKLKAASTELVPLPSSKVTVEPGNILANVPRELTLNAFFDEFEDYDESKEVRDKDNNKITNGYIGTGCTVKLYDADGEEINSYTVKIVGDIDGDGLITATDYTSLKALLKSSAFSLDDVSVKAADINGDGKYTVFDYIALKRFVSGSYSF